MPTSLLLEVCVTTVEEAVIAVEAGADRLELCSALDVGGVTPSLATFLDVRTEVTVPVVVLVRPRPGGFVYTKREFATLCCDADWFLAGGAAAVVCGALSDEGRLHHTHCRELVRLGGGSRVVLHRAFDFLPNLMEGLNDAIDIGFNRVLTSGGATSALRGSEVIGELQRRAAGRIELLPGAGITHANVAELIEVTGCRQVHGSFRTPVPTASHAVAASMGEAKTTDSFKVAAVRSELDRISAR